MENGEQGPGLSILNVSQGDFKITFDNTEPGELERAKKTITDMLKRGYAIMVITPDGQYRRAKKFDPQTVEYIVKDVPEIRLPAARTPAVAVARSAGGCAREAW
jgi:hypothetical protein